MSIDITIEGKSIGTGQIFTDIERAHKVDVSGYQMIVRSKGFDDAVFTITRDTAHSLAHPEHRYKTNGECPPSKDGEPYHARIRTDGPRGYRLELYEPSLCIDRSPNLLQGTGQVPRTSIQIHKGPGYTQGCFSIMPDKAEHERFCSVLHAMMEGSDASITVTVKPREVEQL